MNLLRKKNIQCDVSQDIKLQRSLSTFDLIFMGIGAIIGSGIFIVTGIVAATKAGPGIIFSYIIAGFACGFSALSYAELAASLGGCGSAYGYAYVGFGELIAWIVGWDLLFEYMISVSAVSVGWSAYCNSLLHAIHLDMPTNFVKGPWNGGVFDVLSVGIVAVVALLHLLGTKLSAKVNNIVVSIKLAVVLLFIVFALRDVNPQNWTPFLPFGWLGVVKGASLIFFAYIGFDAVSTAAEEVQVPQRSLPIGILASLLICTTLYMAVSILLTGVVPYTDLNVGSPLSHALLMHGRYFAASTISIGAITGLTTVIIVFFYGLTRIMLAMSRDGLLPNYFAKLNKYTGTPSRIILLMGILTAGVAALLPMHELIELVNIGTLVAFCIVCAGVIVLRYHEPNLVRPFKTPLMPLIPILGLISCFYLICNLAWYTLFRFAIWLLVGLLVYFGFSIKHSKLKNDNTNRI
ncbi:amino acid permease [bacterium]|nr:amino acid permease [bacterium]